MICHILYSRVEYLEQVGFDSDGSSVIVDESKNSQVFSEEDMFADKIDPIISNGVSNIGWKDLILGGIVTVRWSWTGDERQLHTKKFNIVL